MKRHILIFGIILLLELLLFFALEFLLYDILVIPMICRIAVIFVLSPINWELVTDISNRKVLAKEN